MRIEKKVVSDEVDIPLVFVLLFLSADLTSGLGISKPPRRKAEVGLDTTSGTDAKR
jgi:hypothetical protein